MLRCIVGVLIAVLSSGAGAQVPQPKVVRIVNPFAAGGNTDLVTRALIERLTPMLKQQFIIENRPGAMTNIASEYVIKAPPDGATLLMGGASNAINMSLFVSPPYDTLRDFEPVVLCFRGANVLAVHPSLPARNLRELVALAKAQPGKLNYATSGLGSSNHIGGELLRMMAKIDIQHIPYKGNNPALTDTLGGHVHMLFAGVPAVLPHVESGRLRAVGISTLTRSPTLPAVPTFDESGVKGYEATNWFGLLAPAKTPREAVDRMNRAVDGVVRSADFRERFVREGLDAAGGSPESFGRFLREEIDKYAK
ncbi:MAG TPA: tripartite tricarboxylate transporter substrate binding protein, partial [Burkholderiales bacterium]|nr:tripartite tricarboxylate transporter substrate binding protein [Burkholderiales bacterium]